ncbi:MAG: flagellar hook-associated protein FlgL [Candidatus Cloacimonetes bacterium]|nr:flagellar hook-associated protein FlgL [Candidatus Cloacimonadota bacterium]
MRVTSQALVSQFLSTLNTTNSKLSDINNKISSGKRVDRPQDDPVAAAGITRVNSKITENVQFDENIKQSLSELNTIDTTLGDISAILMRSRELAVQGANQTLSLTERDAIAVEVNQLLESMVQIGNSTMGGAALFAGHETAGKPFEVVRGSGLGEVNDIVTIDGEVRPDLNINNITRVVYKGDSEKTKIEVDQDLAVKDNITGKELFYYGDNVQSSGPSLGTRSIAANDEIELSNLMNARNIQGISQGYIYVKNSSALQLNSDTNPGAVDNSTSLNQLNNRRGIGRDNQGNIVGFGHVSLTDSAGTNIVFDSSAAAPNGVPSPSGANATIMDAVNYLNGQTYDAAVNPAGPRLRFSLEGGQIKMTDNANGSGLSVVLDEGGTGAVGANMSTFAQDLGVATQLQPKTVNAGNYANVPVGMLNDFGGINPNGQFTISFQGGVPADVVVDMSVAGLNGTSTMFDVETAINGQINAAGLAGGPFFSINAQGKFARNGAAFPAPISDIIDQNGSTIATDLGIDSPTVNPGFPNLSQKNEGFPGLTFDLRTTLGEWSGEQNISNPPVSATSRIRLQNSRGQEDFVDLFAAGLTESSTVQDLITTINASNSTIKAELSTDGFGLTFKDSANGTGNFYIEDFGGSTIVETLAFGTPDTGSLEDWNPAGGVLVDLNAVGDTILTVNDLLESINEKTQKIGVEASIDSDTGELIFMDERTPNLRGKHGVSVENAVGLQTKLEQLNDGGGINNYKIRITDSSANTQVIDFQQATTLEDVINAINLSYEPIDEKTKLKEVDALSFPMTAINVASSTGSVNVNLGALNEASTMQDLLKTMRVAIAPIQLEVDFIVNSEDKTGSFKFTDKAGGEQNGNISIIDIAGGVTAQNLKINSVAQASPYEGKSLVHKRVNVTAQLSDDRSGIKITDNLGGDFSITEVEGRSTAHDLGLIDQGVDISTSKNGILVGSNVQVFQKIADELGVGATYSSKIVQSQDTHSSIRNLGTINNHEVGLKSKSIKTIEMSTLVGSVDLDKKLTYKTELSHLNNSRPNPDYRGNPIENVDLSGVLLIENMIEDPGNPANFESIQLDFRDLPDNPSYKDLENLIQDRITSDSSFRGKIDLQVTSDGKLKFLSDVPIRVSSDPSGGGAMTFNNMFGVANTTGTTDFSNVLESDFLGLEKEATDGIDLNNFFIDDFSGDGNLEVDLNAIAWNSLDRKEELAIEDVRSFIDRNARRPAELTATTSMKDLRVNVNLAPGVFNDTTVADYDFTEFKTRFDTLFAGDNLVVEIADGTTNSSVLEKGKKLVVVDTTAGARPNVAVTSLTPQMIDLFDRMGLQVGGNTTGYPSGKEVIAGRQITGVGYDINFSLSETGKIQMAGEGVKDSKGNRIAGTGKLKVLEGRGSTGNDFSLIDGTGVLGNGTSQVESGDLNPGVDKTTLLSELDPNNEGVGTDFMTSLKDIYIENGNEEAFIKLTDPPIALNTPFKAFNNGEYNEVTGLYDGGVDVGRPFSGFVITDQMGNEAIVDLSNNLSAVTEIVSPNTTASDPTATGSPTRFTTPAGPNDFTNVSVGEFLEISGDAANTQSQVKKYKIVAKDPAGTWVEVAEDFNNEGFSAAAGNYEVSIPTGRESLSSKMEKEYSHKPFYNEKSTLNDLQIAINIAIDKAKRTNGFGIDKIELAVDDDSSGFRLNVFGANGPTVTISERDVNGDGKTDSNTAQSLGLLRENGAKGNGSPRVVSGPIKVAPTISYLMNAVNTNTDAGVTLNIGNNGKGPTLDITSNKNSSYIKTRDGFDGNTSSQTGMSSTRSIFQTMIDFRDSLFRDDTKTISDLVLQRLNEDEEKVLQVRAQVGSVVNRFETNSDRLSETKIQLTSRLSDYEDLNITDAIIELRQLETSQRAALSVGSRILQQSLLDFI